jgi:hypothetical protein
MEMMPFSLTAQILFFQYEHPPNPPDTPGMWVDHNGGA